MLGRSRAFVELDSRFPRREGNGHVLDTLDRLLWKVIAINKDADANIFKAARFGIVGDYKTVMPPLIEAIKKAKAEG